jgi:predicted GIY-YIG superfamily endonuclease
MYFIYILKLKDSKYYIGKSRTQKTLFNRLQNHFSHNGAVWTKRYKPIEVIDIINIVDEKFMEDRIVFEYMKKYGIENVRGGSFCKVKLPVEEQTVIKRIINTEEDKCFICNSSNHMSNDCYKYKNNKNKINKRKEKKNCCEIITNYFKSFLIKFKILNK